MGLKASKTNQSKFNKPEALEAGTYPARVVRVLDMGIQPQRAYQGKDKEPAHEISVTYELVDEFMKDEEGNVLEDKPRWVSETFVLHSMEADLAKSTKRMKAIDPNNSVDGDWSEVLSFPCNVTIVVNQVGDKTYENVANVTTVRAKDAARFPDLKNPAWFFDLTEPDIELFEKLPQWIREKIQGNLKFPGSPLEKALKGSKGVAKEEPKKPAKKAVEAAPEPSEESDGENDPPW